MFASIRKRLQVGSLTEAEVAAKNETFFCAAVCAWVETNDQLALLAATVAAGVAYDRLSLIRYVMYLSCGPDPHRKRESELMQFAAVIAKMPVSSQALIGGLRMRLSQANGEYRRAFDARDDEFFITRYSRLAVIPMIDAIEWGNDGKRLRDTLTDPTVQAGMPPELVEKLRLLFPKAVL